MAKSKGAAADAPKGDDAPSRRELAVARSLDSARVRAENRVQMFLDAAVELMDEDPNRDFTVQEVVDRSGQSLRSFYQYFDGKYELLLALFEESVRNTVAALTDALPEGDAVARLRTFVLEYHAMCRPARTGRARPTPGIGRFAQQLLTEHPKEAAAAFGPLVDLARGLLDDAVAAGALRDDLATDAMAGVLLQSIMFNSFATIISGKATAIAAADADPEVMWGLYFRGLER
ncbi:MAG: TetR/AcrR family transcriptional regulator [Acidimicrobiia bacterium]